MRWLRLSRPALWSLLNNSGLDGRGLSVCWNPDCRCRLLLKSRRLAFSGFLPLDVLSPAVGDIFRSDRCRCVRCSGKPHHYSFSNPFRHFTYITTHSPTLLFYLYHSSFSNPSVTSPTSQFMLQPFFRFYYATSSSLNSPGSRPWKEDKSCGLNKHNITRLYMREHKVSGIGRATGWAHPAGEKALIVWVKWSSRSI